MWWPCPMQWECTFAFQQRLPLTVPPSAIEQTHHALFLARHWISSHVFTLPGMFSPQHHASSHYDFLPLRSSSDFPNLWRCQYKPQQRVSSYLLWAPLIGLPAMTKCMAFHMAVSFKTVSILSAGTLLGLGFPSTKQSARPVAGATLMFVSGWMKPGCSFPDTLTDHKSYPAKWEHHST